MQPTSMAPMTASTATFEKRAIFSFTLARERHLRPAEEHVGLDADLAHLLDRVLRRLRLELARRRDVRHERDVDVERVLRARLDLHLADGLEERERLDVADRAADLDDGDVDALGGVARPRALISSVMCGITCTVAPRYSPRRSFEMTLS